MFKILSKFKPYFLIFILIYRSKEECNWSEGPKDFAKLIGNRVSKLVELVAGEDAIFSEKSNTFPLEYCLCFVISF
jgi:hypothetical protein